MRVCSEPGCPAIQDETRCPEHRRQHERARGSSTARGYGRDHQKERARVAPLVAAGKVKCWRCGELIVGAFDLGHDDSDRSKYRGPEHPACNRATSGRAACKVTVVCGPPCAGKTTWVREHAQPGDLIVDYDDIARRLGSRRDHGHHPSFHKPIEATIARAIAGIRRGRHERAWIIRSGVERARLLARDLDGTLVLLNPPDDVLTARANERRDPQATLRAIAEWRKTHPNISRDA